MYGNSVVDATTNSAAMLGLFMGIMIFSIIISLIYIISYAKVFKKAGKPWWASLVPIYNTVVMIQIAKLPIWYIILFLIPIANIYALFKINIEIAKKFGKGTGFGIGMTLLNVIFIPLLAFSDDLYEDNVKKEENVNNGFDANQDINNNVISPEESIPTLEDNSMSTIVENNNVSENSIPTIENEVISNVEDSMSLENNIPTIENQNINSNLDVNNNVSEDLVDQNNEVSINEPLEMPEQQMESVSEVNAFNIAPSSVETLNNEVKIEQINEVEEEINPEIVKEGIETLNDINIDNTIELATNIAEDKKVCKNCGNELPEIVSICPNCGTDNE